MMMKVLITGAASGIGYQLARVLAYLGHEVYAGCHKEKEILFQPSVPGITFIPLDLLSLDDFSLFDEEHFDCVVCQAGIGHGGDVLSSLDSLKECFDTNVFGTLRLIQKYTDSLARTKKCGKILITSSLLGDFPIPYLGTYSSSKACLTHLSKVLRREMECTQKNIRVHLVLPGAYHTGFNQVMLEEIEDSFVRKRLEHIFMLLEKKETKTIVNKMVKVILNDSSQFVVSAPFFQSLSIRILRIFSF